MKRNLSLLLSFALVLLMLAGCSSSSTSTETTSGTTTETTGESTVTADTTASSDVVVMKFAGTATADESNGEYAAMEKFEELVEKYSNGTIDVQLYPASQLGSSTEFTEGVSLGTVECGMAGFDGIAQYAPSMYAFSMPYQYDSIEQMRSVIEGDTECRAAIDSALDEINMKIVGIMYRPFRVIANTKHPVSDPDDLSDITLRVPDAACSQSILSAMGATTATISWSEVYTSIQQGVIDGCENAITELASNNLQEVVKYVSETRHMSAAIPIFVSESWFNGLTQEQQDAIVKAGEEVTEWRYENVTEETEEAWKKFEDAGVQILYYDDIDIDAFKAATANVYKDFVNQGYFTEEFYQSTLPTK